MATIAITPGVTFEEDDFWLASGAVSINERFSGRTDFIDDRVLTLGRTSATFSELQFEANGLTYRYLGNWTLSTNTAVLSSSASASGAYNQVIVEQNGTQIASLTTDGPLSVNFGTTTGVSVAGLVNLQPVLDVLFSSGANQSFANLHLTITPNLPDLAGIEDGQIPGSGSTTPSPEADYITGSAGDDTISALQGDDTVLGGSGNDSINGNQGNDWIDAGSGSDFVQGGQDNDTLNGGADNDIVYGDFGDDIVNGNLGDDEVNGNVGNDTVRGGQGNDTISGGQDNDVLYGDLGNDLLSGDLGNDTMTGGGGADVFEFRPGQGNDVIADFNGAEGDRLSLFGQTYVFSEADGSTTLTFSDGNTLVLTGVTADEFSSQFVV